MAAPVPLLSLSVTPPLVAALAATYVSAGMPVSLTMPLTVVCNALISTPSTVPLEGSVILPSDIETTSVKLLPE